MRRCIHNCEGRSKIFSLVGLNRLTKFAALFKSGSVVQNDYSILFFFQMERLLCHSEVDLEADLACANARGLHNRPTKPEFIKSARDSCCLRARSESQYCCEVGWLEKESDQQTSTQEERNFGPLLYSSHLWNGRSDFFFWFYNLTKKTW